MAARGTKFSESSKGAPPQGDGQAVLDRHLPMVGVLCGRRRWKVLASWFAVYVSVLLWMPTWTLLDHLMTSIALSTQLMAEFGLVSDGLSLYVSSLITSKLYQFYAITLSCKSLPVRCQR